jgi:hypothetical protein
MACIGKAAQAAAAARNNLRNSCEQTPMQLYCLQDRKKNHTSLQQQTRHRWALRKSDWGFLPLLFPHHVVLLRSVNIAGSAKHTMRAELAMLCAVALPPDQIR